MQQRQIWVRAEAVRFLVEAVVESVPSRTLNVKGAPLVTEQEHGIVRLVAEFLTNRDIADELNLSEITARNYAFRDFEKLGTFNRVKLTLYGLRQQT